MAFKSKYTGPQVEGLLDQMASVGDGITVETDPIFLASPAAGITSDNIWTWNSKQDAIADLQAIRAGADKGATALQSYEEKYTGTVTSVKINGSTKNPDADGLVDLGNIEGSAGGSVIVDDALSDTSTNPVQNKVLAEALDNKVSKDGGTINGDLSVTGKLTAERLNGVLEPLNTKDANTMASGYAWVNTAAGGANIPHWAGTMLSLDANVNNTLQIFGNFDSATYYIRNKNRDSNSWHNWQRIITENSDSISPVSGGLTINGSIKANDYLDAYGISLYETFATKTELEEALQGGGGNEVVSIKLTLNGSTTTTNVNGAKVVVNNISKGTTATYSWAGNDITATVPAGDTFSVVCHACNSYAPPAEFSSVAIKGNNRTVTLNYITAPTGVYFCSNTGALTGSKDDNTVGIYVGSSSLKRVITPNKYSGYITGSQAADVDNGRAPTAYCIYIGLDDEDYTPWLPTQIKNLSLLGKSCYIPSKNEYSMLGSNISAVTSYVDQFGAVYSHNDQPYFSDFGFLFCGSQGPLSGTDEPIYEKSFGMVEY